MIEFYPDGSALIIDDDRLIESTILDPKVVQAAQSLAGEVTEFWMIALALELGDNRDRDDHFMFCESGERCRVCQKNTGIEDVNFSS